MRSRERGSVVVLMVALVAVVAVLAGVVGQVAAVTLARHRAAAAADLAALAAVDGGCARAAEVARANGALVSRCRPAADGSVTVSVRATPAGAAGRFGEVEVSARAGRARKIPALLTGNTAGAQNTLRATSMPP